jgi:hypothetical protein
LNNSKTELKALSEEGEESRNWPIYIEENKKKKKRGGGG